MRPSKETIGNVVLSVALATSLKCATTPPPAGVHPDDFVEEHEAVEKAFFEWMDEMKNKAETDQEPFTAERRRKAFQATFKEDHQARECRACHDLPSSETPAKQNIQLVPRLTPLPNPEPLRDAE